MANITKPIDRAIFSSQRYVTFASSELSTGDVIQVEESLGRSADTLTIEVAQGSDLSIRLNCQGTVYPVRKYPEENQFGWADNGQILMASGVNYDTGVGRIAVGSSVAGVNYQLTDIPISDLEVNFTTASGTFTILLS